MRLTHLFNEGSNWHTDPEQQSMDATRRARLGREREPAGSDTIDARLAANNNARQEYAETGRFWLKQKDTQQHLNDQPYTGKAAANVAALELLKQQPELRGNLVITAYGPGEQQVTEGRVKELGQDLKDRAMSDAEFKKKYSKTRAEVRAAMREKPGVAEGSIGDKIKGAAKSVKRASQGWGAGGESDAVSPKDVVQAFGKMDGQRLANFVASRKDLSKPRNNSARAFADKVIDREMKQRGYGRVADKDEPGVAEGIINTIANKVMGAAPEQPKYQVGQRVKYETNPHQPDWKDGGSGVGVITAYKNGHYMINGNPVNHFEIKGVVDQGVAEGDTTKKLSGATPAPAPNPYLKDILMRHIEEVRRFVQTGYIDPTEPMFQELYEYFANEIPEPVRRSPSRLVRRIGDMIAPYAKFYASASTMNEQGVAEGSDEMVGFHLDSERAYEAVMAKFGHVIDHDEDSGTMYVPERLWPTVEATAYDADGIGAQRDDELENPEHYGVDEAQYDSGDYYNARIGSEYGRDLNPTGNGGPGAGTKRDDIFKGQSKQLPADPFGRTSGAVPRTGTGRIHSTALPDEMDEGEKVGNMDAGRFDAAMARLKKLAGAGPMRTVYDPEKRVYQNVPVAQQPGDKK